MGTDACAHDRPDVSPLQLKAFRLDDNRDWIWVHGYFLQGGEVRYCGRPEPWRYHYYMRFCCGCGIEFSNPWVPVCEDCYAVDGYPSWERVIRWNYSLDNSR